MQTLGSNPKGPNDGVPDGYDDGLLGGMRTGSSEQGSPNPLETASLSHHPSITSICAGPPSTVPLAIDDTTAPCVVISDGKPPSAGSLVPYSETANRPGAVFSGLILASAEAKPKTALPSPPNPDSSSAVSGVSSPPASQDGLTTAVLEMSVVHTVGNQDGIPPTSSSVVDALAVDTRDEEDDYSDFPGSNPDVQIDTVSDEDTVNNDKDEIRPESRAADESSPRTSSQQKVKAKTSSAKIPKKSPSLIARERTDRRAEKQKRGDAELARLKNDIERDARDREFCPKLSKNMHHWIGSSKLPGSSRLSFSTLGVSPGNRNLSDLYRALAKHFCKDDIMKASSSLREFIYDVFMHVITPNRLIAFSRRSPPFHDADSSHFLTEGSTSDCQFELGRVTSALYRPSAKGTDKVYKAMWITPVTRTLPGRTKTLFVRPSDGVTTAGHDVFAIGDWILYVPMRSMEKQDFHDDKLNSKHTREARETKTTFSGKRAKQQSDEARCLWELPRFSIKDAAEHFKRAQKREARTARPTHEHKRDDDAVARDGQHGAESNPIDVDCDGSDDKPTKPPSGTASSTSSSSSSSSGSLSSADPPPAASPGSRPVGSTSAPKIPVVPLDARVGVPDSAHQPGFALLAARAVMVAYHRSSGDSFEREAAEGVLRSFEISTRPAGYLAPPLQAQTVSPSAPTVEITGVTDEPLAAAQRTFSLDRPLASLSVDSEPDSQLLSTSATVPTTVNRTTTTGGKQRRVLTTKGKEQLLPDRSASGMSVSITTMPSQSTPHASSSSSPNKRPGSSRTRSRNARKKKAKLYLKRVTDKGADDGPPPPPPPPPPAPPPHPDDLDGISISVDIDLMSDYDEELFLTPPRDADGADADGLPALWGSTLEEGYGQEDDSLGWEDVPPEPVNSGDGSYQAEESVRRKLDLSNATRPTPMVNSPPPLSPGVARHGPSLQETERKHNSPSPPLMVDDGDPHVRKRERTIDLTDDDSFTRGRAHVNMSRHQPSADPLRQHGGAWQPTPPLPLPLQARPV